MRLLSCIGVVCALALGIVPEARAGNVFGSRSVFGPPVFFSPYLPSPAQGAPGSPPAAAGGMTAGLPPAQAAPAPPPVPAGVPHAPGPDAGGTDPRPPGGSSACPEGQDQSGAGSGSGKEDHAGE